MTRLALYQFSLFISGLFGNVGWDFKNRKKAQLLNINFRHAYHSFSFVSSSLRNVFWKKEGDKNSSSPKLDSNWNQTLPKSNWNLTLNSPELDQFLITLKETTVQPHWFGSYLGNFCWVIFGFIAVAEGWQYAGF